MPTGTTQDTPDGPPSGTPSHPVLAWCRANPHMALGIILAAAAAAWIAWFYLVNPRDGGWGYDFQAYQLAAIRLANGDSLYQSVTLDGPFRPGPWGLYLYAPPLAVALLSLSRLDLLTATSIWYLLHVVALVAACAILPVRRLTRVAVFAAGAFSTAVWSDLALGNVNLLLLFAAALMWRWLDRPAGSIGLALALVLRPAFALFLVWFTIRRRFRPIAWTVCAVGAMVVVTLPFVGIDGYTQYLTVLRNVSGATGVMNNQDLASTVLRSGWPDWAATTLWLAGSFAAIGAMLLSLRRDRELSFMVTLGATLMLSPLLWDHYLVLSILTAAFLADRWRWWAAGLPLLAWVTGFQVGVALAMTLLPLLARSDTGRTPEPATERGSISPPERSRAPS